MRQMPCKSVQIGVSVRCPALPSAPEDELHHKHVTILAHKCLNMPVSRWIWTGAGDASLLLRHAARRIPWQQHLGSHWDVQGSAKNVPAKLSERSFLGHR